MLLASKVSHLVILCRCQQACCFFCLVCREVSTFDYFKVTILKLLKHWFCVLSRVFDLKSERLKIIISLVHGEGLKAFLKSWIGSFFCCQFKVRGQAFMRLSNYSFYFYRRGKLLVSSFLVFQVLEQIFSFTSFFLVMLIFTETDFVLFILLRYIYHKDRLEDCVL